MSAAVALSAVLHVFLIYGFSLPADSGPGTRVTVIHAQLRSPQPSASPQRAKTPERDGDGSPDSSRRAPVVLSPPAPDAVAEPSTAPSEPAPAASASSDATSPNIPDPVHYPAKELDIYPRALKRITPVYPQAARDAQVAGSVTLLVLIDEAGRVLATSVMDAAPDGVFEQAAQQALANAAFYPAQKDGRTVRSRILIKVEFEPTLADATQ
jgi:periplasmic protein TonB